MTTEACTVLVWGDSIAASGWPQRAEFIHNVALNTGRSIRVVNKGCGGLPAAMARKQFSETVLPERPHIVIMQFGLNDLRYDGSRGELPLSTPEEFEEHLTDMIKMCREQAGAAVLVFGNHKTRVLVTMPTGLSYDETRAQYNGAAKRAAAAAGAPYCDMEERLCSYSLSPSETLSDDGVHLSPHGIQAYSQIAASEIAKCMRTMEEKSG